MGVKTVKTIRLTCDGRIRADDGFEVECAATADVQTTSKSELISDLTTGYGGLMSQRSGWRIVWPNSDEIICPRRDHTDWPG